VRKMIRCLAIRVDKATAHCTNNIILDRNVTAW
jgi:hypothetical protein